MGVDSCKSSAGPSVTISQALLWMNIHRELLGVDQRALHRLRALVATSPDSPGDCEADVQLVVTEIERVLKRLKDWEETVDRLR